jgi:long-subunit fatty acid transport protein
MKTSLKPLIVRTLQCFTLLVSTGLCLSTLAQESEQLDTAESVPTAEQGAKRVPVQVTLGGSHQFNTPIDGGGDFSITRFRAGLSLPLRFNDQFALATAIKYQLDDYDFDGGGDPWDTVETFTVAALLQYRLDEHWMVYGGPLLRTAAELGADLGDATTGGGALAAKYTVDENLTLGGGFLVMGQLEDNTLVMPILTLDWNFADEWRLKVGFTDLATAGYGAELLWNFHPKWQLAFGGTFHKSRFRLDTNDGIGQEKSFTLSVAATWSPNKTFSGTAFVGLATGGQLQLEDSDGTELAESDYDPAAILGLKAAFRF